jgi:uncharacterized membrane protein
MMGFGGWLFLALLWSVLFALVPIMWLVVRQRSTTNRRRGRLVESAADLLDKRFARGEIDEPTYIAQHDVLIAARGSRRSAARLP